jgi:hypothetical protein
MPVAVLLTSISYTYFGRTGEAIFHIFGSPDEGQDSLDEGQDSGAGKRTRPEVSAYGPQVEPWERTAGCCALFE